MTAEVNRRELLKSFTAVVLGSAALQLPAADSGAPVFFSKADFALLDTIAELIIPADDHSPGGHAAGVAKYIDDFVARSIDPDEKKSWTKGLAYVNSLSVQMNQKSFLSAGHEEQVATLNNMDKNEKHSKSYEDRFWGQLKQTTAFAYYTSSIGIHQEMEYKGNVILEEFVGYDAT